jgi:hypothetical protein
MFEGSALYAIPGFEQLKTRLCMSLRSTAQFYVIFVRDLSVLAQFISDFSSR